MATSYKFILRPQSGSRNSEFPIMLQIIIDRKNCLVSTKKYSSTENWQSISQNVSKKHTDHKTINSVLKTISSEIDFQLLSISKEDKTLKFDDIKNIVKKYTGAIKQVQSSKILEYFNEHAEILKTQNRLGYAGMFLYTKNNLSKFLNDKDISFSDFDLKYLLEYEIFLSQTITELTTRSAYLRTFRTLWNKALKNKNCPENHYPFKNFNFSQYNNPRTKKRAITKEQIEKIALLEIETKNDRLYNSRNYFLFSYYCRGMNFTDIADLKWENIIDGEMNYERSKTGEKFCFKLHAEAFKIMAYYKNLKGNSDAGYIFPILYKRHADYKSKFYRKKKVIKHVNSDIKELGVKAGIEKKITTYVARHTYASTLKRSGFSNEVIGQTMGHDSVKTTQIYIDDIGDPILDDQINGII